MSFEFLKNRSNAIKVTILLLISIALISCETVSYYTQAARGQLAIVFGREDIQRLLADENLSPILRDKFNKVLQIREFSAQELLLPVDDNYLTYVDVEREHVVWNVFATPEFSTDPVNWCYPIAGCVSYRGYFSEPAATRYALQLEEDGFDVYTGGVDAYSTLGWFEDSLLSTVISREDYQLAGLIFHELAHQLTYVAGDTTFNESFASTVEREGLRRWLLSNGQAETIDVAALNQSRQQQFINLVIEYRDKFDALYEKEITETSKRSEKTLLQNQLRDEYQSLKQEWQGYAGYDGWFSMPLNNAQLSTVGSYNDLVPFFTDLLHQSNEDLAVFYAEVERIAGLSDVEREELLENWQ
ncbi:MAG: aminopeptidase [SAR86 cluster bacterium]|uniref:Aminopeptidase n=1 Tax=SAR86 cluster bacterium TaxID=2030880 RepID=A0A2A5AW78_9GAMM|nr:MAG: aminopeptidase [SAR86 cluster bacterium]